MEESQVREFYKGKNVFLTGGTGFLGKGIIAKLMSSCPEIGKIFVLIRAKKGSEGKARLENLIQGPLFDFVKSVHPDFSSKLHAIPGDISLPGLGICETDVALLQEEINIMIHSAATVRFDEPIKQAIKINVAGTLGIINLAKSVKKLEAVLHVSTAYSNCDRELIEEKVYPINMDPEAAIEAFETMSDELAAQISPLCLEKKPNTYTYTKHLAEKLVAKYADQIPISIVRPSIVVPTYEDPFPGWLDNVYGPTGIILAGGKGVLRVLMSDPDKRLDVIPLDCVVNLIIVAAWKTAMQTNQITPGQDPLIYHCCSGKENPFKWAERIPKAYHAFHRYPFNQVLWYPGFIFTQNPVVYFFLEFLLHFLPAFVMDWKAKVCGEKPFMMYIYKKLKTGVTALQYFTLREFDFESKNTKSLYQELNPHDKKTFWFDSTTIQWEIFMHHYLYGIRKHILKEEDKDLETARKNLQKMHLLDKLTKALFTVLCVIVLSYTVGRILGLSTISM